MSLIKEEATMEDHLISHLKPVLGSTKLLWMVRHTREALWTSLVVRELVFLLFRGRDIRQYAWL